MPTLLLAVYLADKRGETLTKKRASEIMRVDPGKTGAKYIALAEQHGLIRIERKPAEDLRKDLLRPSARLKELIDCELVSVARIVGRALPVFFPGEKGIGLQQRPTFGPARPSASDRLPELHGMPAITVRPEPKHRERLADADESGDMDALTVVPPALAQAGEHDQRSHPGSVFAPHVLRSLDELRPYADKAIDLVETFHRSTSIIRAELLNNLQKNIALSGRLVWGSNQGKSLVSNLGRRWGIVPQRSQNDRDLSDALRELLLSSADIVKVVPGTHSYNFPNVGHPDDLQAAHDLTQLFVLLKAEPGRALDGLFLTDDFKGTLVLVGGVSSNALTRLVRQYIRVEGGGLAPIENSLFKPAFVPDAHRDNPTVVIAPQETAPLWGIRDTIADDRLLPEIDKHNRLRTDYFTVTVVPNFLDEASYSKGSKIVIFAGLYGVGTMGGALLVQDVAFWNEIQKSVGSAKAWQALFQVNRIDYRGGRPMPISLNKEREEWRCYPLSVPGNLHRRFLDNADIVRPQLQRRGT